MDNYTKDERSFYDMARAQADSIIGELINQVASSSEDSEAYKAARNQLDNLESLIMKVYDAARDVADTELKERLGKVRMVNLASEATSNSIMVI